MKRFRVLVVDDEPGILQFLKLKLKVSGYEVLIANNGLEALEQLQSQDPDLLILDITMPKMDGFETIKQLPTFPTCWLSCFCFSQAPQFTIFALFLQERIPIA